MKTLLWFLGILIFGLSLNTAVLAQSGSDAECLSIWRVIKDSKEPADFRIFIEDFPNCRMARYARGRLRVLRGGDGGGRPAVREPAPREIAEPIELDPVEAEHVVLKPANVRAAPSRQARIVVTLRAGAIVFAPGKTMDGNWYKIEINDRPIGYIYKTLLQDRLVYDRNNKRRAVERRRKAALALKQRDARERDEVSRAAAARERRAREARLRKERLRDVQARKVRDRGKVTSGFGVPGRTYRAARGWHITFVKKNAYIWRLDSDIAAEVIANSNGWWRLRRNGDTGVVFPVSGFKAGQKFYFTPRAAASDTATIIRDGAAALAGEQYGGRLTVTDGRVRVYLHDKGYLDFTRNREIVFTNYKSKRRTYASRGGGQSASVAFGIKDRIYRVGRWHLTFHSSDAYIWQPGGGLAAEVLANTNGWWRMRKNGRMGVVWSVGNFEPGQSFKYKPWTRKLGRPIPVSRGEKTLIRGKYRSKIWISNGWIYARLPDKGLIGFAPDGRRITFRTYINKNVTFR